MKRLVLASPTYGPTEPEHNRNLRAAIMHASRHGVEWMGDASPNRMKFEAGREGVVKSVIESEDADQIDGICWVDSDMVLEVDTISRLAAHQVDFVTGIYFQREPPHWPLIATHSPIRDAFNWLVKWPENVLAPIDGCGFGICITSLRLIRAMKPPYFEYKKFSEDFDFCLRAGKVGYPPHVDTAIFCGHLRDPQPATIEDFKKVNQYAKVKA